LIELQPPVHGAWLVHGAAEVVASEKLPGRGLDEGRVEMTSPPRSQREMLAGYAKHVEVHIVVESVLWAVP